MPKKVESSFKERLESFKPQVGTFVKIYSAEIIEILGMAGFDFIIIDMEHTTLEFHQVEQMVRVADLHGLASIVRIPDSRRSSILRALDLGATGIQVPQIEDSENVKDVVDKAKYPPQGTRGATFAHRAASFGYTPKNYFEEENEKSLVAVHIETENAYNTVEEICMVPGVDVIFIGPLDLSISLGTGSDFINGELSKPVLRIIDACRQNGKIPGIAISTKEQFRFAVEHRIPYIAWSSDVALFKQAADSVVSIKKDMFNVLE